jgi:hypothetical protein
MPPPGACPADPGLPCPRQAAPGMITAIVARLSGPGDLVVVPCPSTPALITAPALAGRRVLALPARPGPAMAAALAGCLDPAGRPLARLDQAGPETLLQPGAPDAGQAALAIITACAACGQPPGSDLLAACHRVLRPGGLLAICTAAARAPAYPGHLTAAARAAGLTYLQHIITVHAAVDGSQLRAPAGPPPGQPRPAVHTDLLLYTR